MRKLYFVLVALFISFHSFAQTRLEAENYSTMSGVSTENGWGDGGCVNIAPIDQGDWMEYVINPNIAGTYIFTFRVGTVASGAQLKVKKTDGTVLAIVDIPAGTDYQMFQYATANIALVPGDITIRIESSAASQWTFNFFEYYLPDGNQIEAENFSAQSGVLAETCMDAGGGLDVGYISQGDWMDYSINLPAAGTYIAKFRTATKDAGQQLQLRNSAGTVLATVNIPITGDWQGWITTQATVTLPAGQQTLRIYDATPNGGWNINWWRLDPTNASPVADAGINQMIAANTVKLNGSGSDPDGTISSYSWTKVSGPSGSSFGTASAAATTVNGLITGTYVFRLTVTDNGGATGTADVTITVVSGIWGTTGNDNIDESLHFIGTINSQPLIFKAGGHSWAKLTPDGTFMANKIKVSANGWADYVFDTSYKLRSLIDVENFIKLHRHLPGVPSEKEVTSEGLNVGDNQAVLLKKIEELTLYIIDINKKLEKISEENKELKKKLDLRSN